MRKRLPRLFPGHVQTWLRAHIWLTFLTVPLILLHSGFHLGSPMTTLLMGLYAVVMLSGIYGLVLQQKLPGWMKEQLPAEIVYEQIPNIRSQLGVGAREDAPEFPGEADGKCRGRGLDARRRPMRPGAAAVMQPETADPMVNIASENRLVDFIQDQLLPYLEARRGEKFRLSHARDAAETFRYLKLRVAEPYQKGVDEMEAWCTERRQLDAQIKMQHWLHGWLFVHVPISFLLLWLTAWHAFVTLFRY